MEIKAYENDIFYDNMGMRLWERRHQHLDKYIENERTLDIGCNDAKFIQRLAHSLDFNLIVGLDIDLEVLKKASDNLVYDQIQDCLKSNRKIECWIKLFHGDALKKYDKLKQMNFEVITLIEVVEHLQMEQLDDICENVFGYLNPNRIIITTPNSDFNVYFKQLNPQFVLRHPDHKFEFSQQEFQQWTQAIALKYNYSTIYEGVGQHKSGEITNGYASQICIFTKIKDYQHNFKADQDDLQLILEHCLPYDNRTDEQKLIDDIMMNYSRFSLWNQNDLDDYEYDLLSTIDENDILIRIQDLPRSQQYFEQIIQKYNNRFSIYQNDYLLLKFQVQTD
ncbi:unnamed protein product [Paramecium sonneborni]|uniref:Small RNA 2'-O-methyltransferase n=1 Tax=Paramecium sonneborni TaxID=65129 RepID=A0A8S1RLJ0_9CILI|nr:unnamed protein product [Paramecium sonneborni]